MPQTTDLIPQAFWFRTAVGCRRVDAIPRSKGRPLGLPESCALPDFGALQGREPLAEIRAGWNAKGLGVAVEVTGKKKPIESDAYAIGGRDEFEVWIDTRDTRDIHRATKFCHRFTATFVGSKKGPTIAVDVAQTKIHRAQADAPTARPGQILAWAEPVRGGYRLELFFPAEALHGFDPETNRRLGFYYRVADPERGDQFLGVGREFPVSDDPSLWATLELRDEPAD